jgi:hypothetical protein
MGKEPDETFREFLDRRECELLEDIAARHAELVPKEAELAEIRRAKAALNILPIAGTNASLTAVDLAVGSPVMPVVKFGVSDAIPNAFPQHVPPPPRTPDPSHFASDDSQQIAALQASVRLRVAATAALANTADGPLTLRVPPYRHLTMKQLVVKALSEHFPQGATAKQLRDFFRDAWGREIARENLSPQLSRLRWDKIIGWKEPHLWFLVPQQSEASSENHSEDAPKVTDGDESPIKRRL